jgi:Holliday junction resolvase RusA-like endonuclease
MSWKIVIPSQPPTVNHAYEPQTAYRRTASGGNVPYSRIGKNAAAVAYQQAAALIVGTAKPSGWQWQGGFIRLIYRFYLARDADCDNLLKILNDAIAAKIDVNDRWFLPMVMSKRVVRDHEARVEVTIIQDGDSEWLALEALAERPDELP